MLKNILKSTLKTATKISPIPAALLLSLNSSHFAHSETPIINEEINQRVNQGEGGDFFEFDNHRLYYTVFPSTFIPAQTAKLYNLKRSKYQNYLNILINPKNKHGGIKAKLNGYVKNLMQQQKQLKFIEISEKNTVYYLAPISISGEENLHFTVKAILDNNNILKAKFFKKIYSD